MSCNLDQIINSVKYVSDQSEYVKINMEKLEEFVGTIDHIVPTHWLSNAPKELLEMPTKLVIQFLLVFESIDFSFWGSPKWNVRIDGKEEDGSMGLFLALLNYVSQKQSADFSDVSFSEFSDILKGNVDIPLLKERYEIVTDISKIVNKQMGGNFYNAIKDFRTDTEIFQFILSKFPCFKDESEYKGQTVYLYKLAQLLTSDIRYFLEVKENAIIDYSHLNACPDYKIPQILRALGIMEYNQELSELVDNKIEIVHDSDMEIEIRGNMVYVIELMKEKLDHKYNVIDINDYVWMQSRNKELDFKPYHLCRTIRY